jgi:hypothetical protein
MWALRPINQGDYGRTPSPSRHPGGPSYPMRVIGADANQLLIDSAIINPQKPVSSELVFFQPKFSSASRSHREW